MLPKPVPTLVPTLGRTGITTQNLTEPYKKHAMKTCIYCQIERPLSAFRRYHHRKVRQMPSCNLCVPPKTLSDMTPHQREVALQTTHRNHSPALVARLNERDKANKRETLSRKLTAVQMRRRKDAWDAAILGNARQEQRWAYTAHFRHKAQLSEGNAVRMPYAIFFDEYQKILKRMVQEIEFKSTRPNAPLNPTEEERNPRNYVTPTEYLKLKTLYSDCTPIPGTRTARDPWFLYWREPTGKKSSPEEGEVK